MSTPTYKLVWSAVQGRVWTWQLLRQYLPSASDPLGLNQGFTAWLLTNPQPNVWEVSSLGSHHVFATCKEAEQFAEASYALGQE